MPDWTIEDRIDYETDRIIYFGSESSVLLYDEAGVELTEIAQNWFIYKNRDRAANAYDYDLKIAELDTQYDTPMASVKTIRYKVNGNLSEAYEHNGIDAPELGRKRTWVIHVNKPKFRNNFFMSS